MRRASRSHRRNAAGQRYESRRQQCCSLEGSEKTWDMPPLEPHTTEEQETLPNGITVAGPKQHRTQLGALTDEVSSVWTNDGKLADIPMRYWLTVLLKEGAEFPKCAKPYPYGPEARKPDK
ncbi:hypothetical protein KEM55_002688 [Ascosphaera atra]|nr:hypothetical protein KEM55_002688 [Ascosphaera atra]